MTKQIHTEKIIKVEQISTLLDQAQIYSPGLKTASNISKKIITVINQQKEIKQDIDLAQYFVQNERKYYFDRKSWDEIEKKIIDSVRETVSLDWKMANSESEDKQKIINCVKEGLSKLATNTYLYQLMLAFPQEENKVLIANITNIFICNAIKNSCMNQEIIKKSGFAIFLGKGISEALVSMLNHFKFGKDIKNLEHLLLEEIFNLDLKELNKTFSMFKKKLSRKTLLYLISTHFLDMAALLKETPRIIEIKPQYDLIFNYDENDKEITNLSEVRRKCLYITYKMHKAIGFEVLSFFQGSDLVSETPHIKSYTELTFHLKHITFDISRELPKITYTPISPRMRNNTNVNILLKKRKQILHSDSNPGISSKLLNKEDLNEVFGKTKYCLNLDFTEEFLTLFLELQKSSIDEIMINPVFLDFISEIYEINFSLMLNQHPTYMKSMIKYAIDFNNMVLPKYIKWEIEIDQKAAFMHKLMLEKVYSKKILFNELLVHIFLIFRFNWFIFDWFADSRGRIYLTSSALNPYLPFARNFISFFNNDKIKFRAEIQELLYVQLESLTNIKYKDNKVFIPETLKTIFTSQNCKFGSIFSFFSLARDINTINKFFQRPLIGFYSLDCSNSGAQHMSMLLKDANLASACSITNSVNLMGKDLYQILLNNYKIFYTNFNDHLTKMKKAYPQLEPKIFTYRKKISSLYKKVRDQLVDENICQTKSIFKVTFNKRLLNKYYPHVEVLIKSLGTILDDINTWLLSNEGQIFAVVFKSLTWNNFLNKKKLLLKKQKATKFELNHFDRHIIRVKTLFTIIKMFNFKHDSDNKISKKYLVRGIVKQAVMTSLYGSTRYGRLKQFESAFTTMILEKGEFIEENVFSTMKRVLQVLEKVIKHSLVTSFPKAMAFDDIIKSMCFQPKKVKPQKLRKQKLKKGKLTNEENFQEKILEKEIEKEIPIEFNIFDIKTNYFHWSFKPYTYKKHWFLLKNKKRYSYIFSNEISFKRIAKSFTANYIQLCDSTLVSIFCQLITKQKTEEKIPCFSIHDRFFIHPLKAHLLKPLLKEAYLKLFNYNYYEKHFTTTPRLLNLRINDQTALTPSAFTNPDFVKH